MNDLNISKLDNQKFNGLYLVATPIGNLADFSHRAKLILDDANQIACEDTRHTRKLLNHFNITTPTTAYHEYNAEKVRPKLLNRLSKGELIVLVSDAGTPLISDPGFKLVREAIELGINISRVPGPNAGIFALILSGLPTNRYLFLGFLPSRGYARKSILEEIANVKASLVIHEAPRRLLSLLKDAKEILGNREAAIARELTKMHEEMLRGSLTNLIEDLDKISELKGEITLVIGPPSEAQEMADLGSFDIEIDELMEAKSPSEVAKILARKTGIPRQKIYQRAISRKNNVNK